MMTTNGEVRTTIQDGNNIYLGSTFTQVGCATNHGTIDNYWTSTLNAAVLAISSNGTDVIAGGNFSFNSLAARNHVACIDLSTNQLISWNPSSSF